MTTRIFIDRFRRRVKKMNNYALPRTLALIRKESREKMRPAGKNGRRSRPNEPPRARSPRGLRVISYYYTETSGYVGPHKFRRSNQYNRPQPNIHEKGGSAVRFTRKRVIFYRFPERSFMYSAVKRLRDKGKLNSQFHYALRKT